MVSSSKTPSPSSAEQAVLEFLDVNLEKTYRVSDPENPREVPVPKPFLVPTVGKQFRNFFYWDTYFACQGLLARGEVEMPLHCADNYLHLIDEIGFVPNVAVQFGLNRSQPPVASILIRDVYEKTGDKEWLAKAALILEKEAAFWSTLRGGPDGLSHYGHHEKPSGVEPFYWIIHKRVSDIPDTPVERMRFLEHYIAEAESGWDFNPRFQRRCMDHYPVDLNALVFALEANLSWMFAETAGESEPRVAYWHDRAEARRERVSRLCWDESAGGFFDFDYINRERSPILAASAFWPLWTGLATEAQAAAMVEKSLPKLEEAHGLTTCANDGKPREQVYQWDHPNAWPPLQAAAIDGLRRYGFDKEAHRLAEKYIDTVCRVFTESGNLWEKYNAVTGGNDVNDEYEMPPMLGWTAGCFLFCRELLRAI